MMQIDLYCPKCLAEREKNGLPSYAQDTEVILSDVYDILDSGIYKIQCSKGHTGTFIVGNLKFELLFDLGLNAIADHYYREAVASLTSALERFYEFFIKVVWRAQNNDFKAIEKNWKEMSSQSERQLGAYIAGYSMLFCGITPVMDNNQKSFRNNVIHKGAIPSREETIKYAKNILDLISIPLLKLQGKCLKEIKEVKKYYLPKYESKDEDENILTINHPTIFCADTPLKEDDAKDIETLIKNIIERRGVKRLSPSFSHKFDFQSADKISSEVLSKINSNVEENNFQLIINPDATIEECLEHVEKGINNYEEIFDWIQNEHAEICGNDIMTIYLGNTGLNLHIYLLYLKSKIFKTLLDTNPENKKYQKLYQKAEEELEKYHRTEMVYD